MIAGVEINRGVVGEGRVTVGRQSEEAAKGWNRAWLQAGEALDLFAAREAQGPGAQQGACLPAVQLAIGRQHHQEELVFRFNNQGLGAAGQGSAAHGRGLLTGENRLMPKDCKVHTAFLEPGL